MPPRGAPPRRVVMPPHGARAPQFERRCLNAWANWVQGLGHNGGLVLDLHEIMIRIISTLECYFRLYSPKNWEFQTISKLATCNDRRPCIGLSLPSHTIITQSVKRRQSAKPISAIV
ncbi:hypothetical protein TNCV_3063711 [Trichonephila clavipes]|nr:hypothetical protein TNCV_3063711 [Trichonephila clavipes]